MFLMVPVAVATSFGFMMPVGTPPNVIAFATGHVTVSKMVRAGSIMNLIGIVIVTSMTAVLAPLIWGN
jgi:sodium-dependent dicarboxylate transporter 2/3/5